MKRPVQRVTAAMVLASILAPVAHCIADDAPAKDSILKFDSEHLNIPFERFTTKDSCGRIITAYLSPSPKDSKNALPVVLWIQGSGSQSLFSQLPGGRIGGGMQNLIYGLSKGRFRVLCVEKPGVKFLESPNPPGTAEHASDEFLKEHTLPRWAGANEAALVAIWTVPGIDKSRTLVIGHSEGAVVAARVAADLPQVTHVAPLAGAGPTQLFSLAEIAARPQPVDQPGDADKRRDKVFADWKLIQADPESISKFWMGHPCRRWSTFCQDNSITELLRSRAKVYLAHGAEDQSSYIGDLDVTRAELAAHGRDFVAERIPGADHSYRPSKSERTPGKPKELEELLDRITTWFLK